MKKVLLLLANGFEIYEASVFIDVLGWNLLEGQKNTQVVICGLNREITGTFGVRLVADVTIGQIDYNEYDALAIPGGFAEYHFYEEAYTDVFLNVIKAFHVQGKLIASICVAALPVAKSGIMQGKRGTTYNDNDRVRQKTLAEFGVKVLNEPIVEDSNIITSWNPATAIDVAFKLLETLTDQDNVFKIKELMGFVEKKELI